MPPTITEELEKVIASANPFYNSINAQGSLSYESQRLLAEAQILKQTHTAKSKCTDSCLLAKDVDILFTTVPNKLQSNYAERNKCLEMQNKTTASPFLFTPESFEDTEAFGAWFSDFSRGNGQDGKKLYELCPGACSPRYSTLIRPINQKLKAEVSVICGEARDKMDNKYQLGIALQWTCRRQ
ncbi:MAG: hypothetical protein IT292_10100 [Deltaproteobacteria bacterium]|nr:hypothetical protein [Deltaproteobacteria bacterium]